MAKGPRHHSTHPGKRVLVRLRNGERYVAQFLESNNRFLTTDQGKVSWSEVKSFSIYKPATHGR